MSQFLKRTINSLILSNDPSIKLCQRSYQSKYSIHFRNVFHKDELLKYLYCLTCKKLISHQGRSTHSLKRHCLTHKPDQISKLITVKTLNLHRPNSRDLSTNVKHRFIIEKIYNFRKRNDQWHALVKWRGHGVNKSSLIPVHDLYKYWDSNQIQNDPRNSVKESDRSGLTPKQTHLSFLQKQTLKSIHTQFSKGI
ncbi:MAG: hypothetical protein FD143_2961 [Ignavibacteria bacterium]|nr:MAG: hypothetical protein FD143_2961 [Ignavibacteria bacterium]